MNIVLTIATIAVVSAITIAVGELALSFLASIIN